MREFEGKIQTMGIYSSFSSIEELAQDIKKDIYANIREVKNRNFIIKPRKIKIGKYLKIEDIGQINSENWRAKAGEITSFIVRSAIQIPNFRTRFAISDLVLIYQIVLDGIGIKFHRVNKDYIIQQLFDGLIEDDIIRNISTKTAAYNYSRVSKDMTIIQENISGKKNRMEIYYGFSRYSSKGINQYSAAIEKLHRKGLRTEIFSEIRKLLPDDQEIYLSLPSYVIENLEKHNPEEFKRQNSHSN